MKMNSDSASNTIDSYRKRQQRGPRIIWTIAAVLAIVGIIVLVFWFTGDNKPQISFFATETPTPTLTYTATVTSSPTATATETTTPTMTLTPTPSVPFSYIVQEGESMNSISEKFELGEDGILLLLALNPVVETQGGVLYVGQEIIVPNPGMELPTPTPVPADLARGTLLNYTVRPGDSVAAIAAKFRSTEDAIIEENELENANSIQVGQLLVIPVNLVTPEPTRLAPTANATATPSAPAGNKTATPVSASCDYKENTDYVAQIFELVNNERVSQSLSPLKEKPQLTAAALVHAVDMVCNSFLKEVGSDGSTPTERVATQGYTASLVLQEIHAQPPEYGGDGQAAFDAWMGGVTLLNPNATEIGIAYAYFKGSALGGYFTVVLAAP
ncbi:MAG: LysM peptidoglycan-binding domain-containing protein [Anaerolineales bacterium]|uniref:LysM peptidoglycan-binding domain-containing protein n=1 Tax=Candidatus Desulfolinea nitratireducens TaxID=2841698 RepID=A0A8J6NQL0_9CHLR|nr:LysM peptidoglycan-binding domain-containing protein [Candidatus Desulfolinea nitratireducens]